MARFTILFFYCARQSHFQRPLDGVACGAPAALGFACIENVSYVLMAGPDGLVTAYTRLYSAIPSHAFAGAIMGYYLAQARFNNNSPALYWGMAFAVPFALHGLYDFVLFAQLNEFLTTLFLVLELMWTLRVVILARAHSTVTYAPATTVINLNHRDDLTKNAPSHSAPNPPRPWIRTFAKGINIVLGVSLTVLLLAFMPYRISTSVLGLTSLLIGWLVIEAAFLSRCGTTPGKWLFKINILKKDGGRPDFSEAMWRGFDVYFRGLGLGIPVLNPLTMLLAFNHLNKSGETVWDRDGDYTLRHGPLSRGRVVVILVLVTSGLAGLGLMPAEAMQ